MTGKKTKLICSKCHEPVDPKTRICPNCKPETPTIIGDEIPQMEDFIYPTAIEVIDDEPEKGT